jgi:hypothetical protein
MIKAILLLKQLHILQSKQTIQTSAAIHLPERTVIMEKTLTLQSIITCPNCGFQKEETMPTDACQYFYKCTNCGTILKPKQGDCCVFCSYGTVPCPPIQINKL